MIGIYKITSPSNRIYIGQGKDIDKRWLRYEKLDCKGQPRLYNSLKKHGFNNHKFEIIEECKFEDLNIKERYWQDYYDVIGENGLNCRLAKTDILPTIFSKETRMKISKANTGRKLSDERKRQISIVSKNRPVKESTREKIRILKTGFKHSEESKLKMSNIHKGKKLSKEHCENMSKVRLGKKSSLESIRKAAEGHMKKVIDTSTNTIYNSIKEAAILNNISEVNLGRYLSGKRKNKTSLKYYEK